MMLAAVVWALSALCCKILEGRLTKCQNFRPESELREFADNKINMTQKPKFVLGLVFNMVGKGRYPILNFFFFKKKKT